MRAGEDMGGGNKCRPSTNGNVFLLSTYVHMRPKNFVETCVSNRKGLKKNAQRRTKLQCLWERESSESNITGSC